MLLQYAVQLQGLFDASLRLQNPKADVEVIVSKVEDDVVQLTGKLQGIPVGRTLDFEVFLGWAFDFDFSGSFMRIHFQGNKLLSQRRQSNPLPSGPVRALGQLERARFHGFGELLRLGGVINEAPKLGAVGAHAFGGRAEDIGAVAPDFALVDDSRQAAGAGEHAEQRNLRQRYGGRPVVDHGDLVAGKGELVAAACGRAVQRRDEFQS